MRSTSERSCQENTGKDWSAPTSSVELKYHVKIRSWKPMQVVKVQGSRMSEPFRAITVLVFPTDTSRAKAMARMYRPGGRRA